MTKTPLPNIRRFFVPDPGRTIFSADLAGADAQVVAWEAEDENLKDAFRKGLKLHIKNTRDMFPEKVKGWSSEAIKATDRPGGIYHNNKKAVHLTNYGGSGRRMAVVLGWTVAESDTWQRKWFGLHPKIKQWHRRVEGWLVGRESQWKSGKPEPRTIYNRFGFRIVYFDRIQGILPEALAWIPQSTVALNCAKGALQAQGAIGPDFELLLDNHDELVFQLPHRYEQNLDVIQHALEVEIPYPDPLTIQWDINMSRKSWGDTKD